MRGSLMDDTSGSSGAAPTLSRVLVSSTPWQIQAEVTLGSSGEEVVGAACGEKTPFGLRVVAQATVYAVNKLWGETGIVLKGASIAEAVGEESVLVVLSEAGEETIGAALVKDGPIPDATVRATLDALSRRLARSA